MFKMKTTITSLLLVAVFVLSEAMTGRLGVLRNMSIGDCPTITNKQDFDIESYLGLWFEAERFEMVFEEGMDCVQAFYTDLENGEVKVHNRARNAQGNLSEIFGTATVKEPGVLLVDFGGPTTSEYHILETDYTSFSTVYNCKQIGEFRFEYAWILSRNVSLSQETLDHAHQVFDNNGIELSHFQSTHQGPDCHDTS